MGSDFGMKLKLYFQVRLEMLLCFTRCATSLPGEVWLEAKIAYVARH